MQSLTSIPNRFPAYFNQTPIEEQLKQNLNQFGLNPLNWSLDFYQKNYFLITNTDENDFQFIGKINATKTNWEFIQLFNI